MMEAAVTFLGGSVVIAALILANAIKAAVETTKNHTVNWNPTITLGTPEKK